MSEQVTDCISSEAKNEIVSTPLSGTLHVKFEKNPKLILQPNGTTTINSSNQSGIKFSFVPRSSNEFPGATAWKNNTDLIPGAMKLETGFGVLSIPDSVFKEKSLGKMGEVRTTDQDSNPANNIEGTFALPKEPGKYPLKLTWQLSQNTYVADAGSIEISYGVKGPTIKPSFKINTGKRLNEACRVQ